VRIPKAVLPELLRDSRAQPYAAPGVVKPFARELLGMSPEEQQAVEAAMQRRFAEVDGKLVAGMTETNLPVEGNVLARRSFALSALAASGFKSFGEQVIAEMGGVVVEERRRLIEANPPQAVQVRDASLDVSVWTDNTGRFKADVKISFNLKEKQKPTPGIIGVVGVVGNVYPLNTASSVSDELSKFLPDGDPNRTPGVERFLEGHDYLPYPTRQRVVTWLQEQAVTRFNKKENP